MSGSTFIQQILSLLFLFTTWCLSLSHRPNALILLNICKLAPHRITTIEGEKQNDGSHDILLITEIAFHKIKEDFLSNGDKSSTSFIEQTSQMLHPLTCGSANKGDYLLFQMSTINVTIPFITHFPTQLFTVERWQCFSCGDLREAKEKTLKQKFQPGCSIWGNYQSGILLLGIKSPSRTGKEKWGEKEQCQALPLWGFYGQYILRISTLVNPRRQSCL